MTSIHRTWKFIINPFKHFGFGTLRAKPMCAICLEWIVLIIRSCIELVMAQSTTWMTPVFCGGFILASTVVPVAARAA